MALYIKDDDTARLVGELARRLGTTKRNAVRTAVQAQLDKLTPEFSLRDRLEAFYKEFPKPEPTGLKADKSVFRRALGRIRLIFDCFAYACAKSVGAALLYKGNDFALTDLAETGDRPGKLG